MLLMIEQLFRSGDDFVGIVIADFTKSLLNVLIRKMQFQMIAIQILCGIELHFEITVKGFCIDFVYQLIDVLTHRKINSRIGKE